MTDGTSSGEGRLEELLAEALARLQQGRDPDLDELCADCPGYRSAVAEALALAAEPVHASHTKAPGSLSGRVFDGRYVLLECIGSGAMGAVYRADDLELGRTVALKFLRTEMLRGPENERRFEREGEVLARLNHPSIATIHDRRRTEGGQAYIVMEYVDGVSMQQALDDRKGLGKEGRLPVREAVEYAVQLARALEVVHEQGIIHRDIKPSNIMLADRGPVLIDFGIASLAAQETLAEGSRGLGTPAYMAPEQLLTGDSNGPSVDVYGLTASLYRALTGHAPYEGTPAEVLAAIPLRDPELPSVLRPDLPRDLLAILDVGLERDPKQRYSSITRLREDLEAFLEHAPVRARYPGPLARTIRRVRRSPATLATLAVILVFCLGLLGIWAYSRYEAARRAERQEAYDEATAQLQPLLTLWHPSDRAMPQSEARARERDLLDRATRNALHPMPSFLLRAAFRWDQGDHEGAVADMETIARRLPGPVPPFVADAYRRAAASRAEAPDIHGAPEPTTPDGVYLLAYHQLRQRDFKAAIRLLQDPRMDGYAPALEQRLLIGIDRLRRKSPEERMDGGRKIHESVLRMEERYGRTTAMTAHLEGLALMLQKRYAEALDAIKEGLALAPYSAGLLENAGAALRRLGGLDEAVTDLRKAIALRPHSVSAYDTLFWVYLGRAATDGEEALKLASGLLDSDVLPSRMRSRLLGELEFERAFLHIRNGETAPARDAAAAALESWRLAGHRDELKVAVMTAISEGRHPFEEVAELAARDPSNWYRVWLALGLMPPQLDEEETSYAKQLLHSLARELAPRARLDAPDYIQPLRKR